MEIVDRFGGTRWQDRVILLLAIWLFVSPWVLLFAAGGTQSYSPAWNAWIFGVVAAAVTLWAMSRAAPWQEWINLAIGIWLFVAPWIIRFTDVQGAAWDHWIVGLLVFFASVSALSEQRDMSAVDYSHAGDKPEDRRF